MNPAKHTVSAPAPCDPRLRWMLRILGLVLATCAVFFLTRDYRFGVAAVWFLCSCASLGTLSLIASWWPAPERDARDMGRSLFIDQHAATEQPSTIKH
jgi:hypothetical protein